MDLFIKNQSNESSRRQPDVMFEILDHQTVHGDVNEKQDDCPGSDVSDVPHVTPSISSNFAGFITFNYSLEIPNSIYYNISLCYLLLLCRCVHL